MPKIAYWLLNRVAYWDQGKINGALAGGIPFFPQNTVLAGQRQGCDPGVLMYEKDDRDEYFIPIPVKCIGDPADLNVPAENLPLFQKTLACYPEYFDPAHPGPDNFYWKKYWDGSIPSPRIFPDLRMVSAPGEGYYRALQKFNEQHPGYRHVLIGYSQGGLVTRYLAWMDEYLFKNALIEAIVTVESPNFGSPLAHNDNDRNLMQNLDLTLAGLLQLDGTALPGVGAILRDLPTENRVDIDWVLNFLEKALEETDPKKDRYRLRRQDPKYSTSKLGYLETARKWLSGLDHRDPSPIFAHKASAFYDLDLAMLGKEGSVLHSTVHSPLKRIQHAAIVGCDSRLDQLAEAGIKGVLDSKNLGFINLGFLSGPLQWFFGKDLQKFFAIASKNYRGVLLEQDMPVLPAIQARMADYQNGVEQGDPRYKLQTPAFGAMAHDFVIPSAYQLIELEHNDDVFCGNWVNPGANHISGGDIRQKAGSKSQDLLVKILGRMRPKFRETA